jgi:CDGSH-type Zn-finger protein
MEREAPPIRIPFQRYIMSTSQKRELLMADVKIEARPNGPYVVTGSIELRDTNGNVLATQERTVLCRCGASTKKPFCDGTHSKIGFQAAAQAVPDSAEKS